MYNLFARGLRGEGSILETQVDNGLNSIATSIPTNLQQLFKLFTGIVELVIRIFQLKMGRGAFIYLEELVDKKFIKKVEMQLLKG
ncbi:MULTISPECIES: hypothetical protein [Bacillus cereus group]|uniref:Uncharacterized protein n=1 Tax=Bacillus cereus VD184 TaxID=1053242 RepID=A0A9W5R9E0_BACCE|nr:MULTISPECIES: hypothetical protein [Bacillus cereus group]EOQ16897.1 hypothetical protein IKC_02347 [Bacillus cereus VD184]PEA16599.1 hypothetical protein CON42_08080 [Bacillus thuringiensis]PEV05696.1 hypothetical protein CN417_20565 [Bacillus thuringiensis]PFB86938.1 hypothetical protein CN273_09075 [Bacillus thuringiensis]